MLLLMENNKQFKRNSLMKPSIAINCQEPILKNQEKEMLRFKQKPIKLLLKQVL